MAATSKLGVWMDYSRAHLIEFAGRTIQLNHIAAEIVLPKGECLGKKIRDIRERRRSEYYRKLAAQIGNYKEVLLFGPNDAKAELLNVLREDKRFSNIKINLEPCERMTENQEHMFVKRYFGS
jgi:stalled ribosome rescue protein Dom34